MSVGNPTRGGRCRATRRRACCSAGGGGGWPKKRASRQPKQTVRITERTAAGPPIRASAEQVGGLRLEAVAGREGRPFNEYLQRYHPLGYAQPLGDWMRY